MVWMEQECDRLMLYLGDIGKVHFIDNAHFDSIPPQERGLWVSQNLPDTRPTGEGPIGITITFCCNGSSGEGNRTLQLIFCHSGFNVYCRWAYFGTAWYGWIKVN